MSFYSHYFVLTVVGAVLLAGCDEIEEQFEKGRYKGTHISVARCIERSNTEHVFDSVIKAVCVRANQFPINTKLTGKAGYITDYGLVFSGTLKNESPDTIVTQLEIRVHHSNVPKMPTNSKIFSDLWIQPGQEWKFRIYSREMSYEPTKEELKLDEQGNPGHSWNFTNVEGVTIEAR